MTNEEAIKILEHWIACYADYDYLFYEDIGAMKKAIEALELAIALEDGEIMPKCK